MGVLWLLVKLTDTPNMVQVYINWFRSEDQKLFETGKQNPFKDTTLP